MLGKRVYELDGFCRGTNSRVSPFEEQENSGGLTFCAEMAFQNKNLWLPTNADCLNDEERGFDIPFRMETKRSHQWSMHASEQELFSNKKQAVDAESNKPMPGIPTAKMPLWVNDSAFHAAQGDLTDCLFGPDPARNSKNSGRNISCAGTDNLDVQRGYFEDYFRNDISITQSRSHDMEDSSRLSHGIGKLNQVRDSVNGVPVTLGHMHDTGDNNIMPTGIPYRKTDNLISLGRAYDNGDKCTMAAGPTFAKADERLNSLGQSFKGDGNLMLMGHSYNKGNSSVLLMGQPFEKRDVNFSSFNQQYETGDCNTITMESVYHKGQENFISVAPAFNESGEKFISRISTHDKQDNMIVLVEDPHEKAANGIVPPRTVNTKDSNVLLMNENVGKGKGITITFEGIQAEPDVDDPSGRIINSYDLLMRQSSVQVSDAAGELALVESIANPIENFVLAFTSRTGAKDAPSALALVDTNADPIVTVVPEATSRTGAKNREPKAPKKLLPNSFPSNVKTLMSTGILDGVPIKYVSWSRENSLRGVIKGSSYLCCCTECKLSKALNAYEFERHAGCKTKHPNNHIYFENGKTIYSVVQELKSTPQESLFDAIQNVTGSPVNEKNFQIWKATRELQRIYGKDEVIMPS